MASLLRMARRAYVRRHLRYIYASVLKPICNPPNPWESTHVEWIGEPPEAKLEVFEEHARSILAENESPDIGFRWSLNPYRGCFHACAYCAGGETQVLMADGQTKSLCDVRKGDAVYGTVRIGRSRRLVETLVLDDWLHVEQSHRIRLLDGTRLIASAEHRFLTTAGWEHVASGRWRPGCRNLTSDSHLLATSPSSPPREGLTLENDASRRVISIEPLGVSLPLYDITTGTGDFIANGVVSHNCYARSSHEYLGFGAGTDFDRKIVVKVNAPEKLLEQFAKRSWTGETIAFSGNTDCYQPLEAVYELTKRCLEICAEYRNPTAIITKSALVRRDIELLARMARETETSVNVSIPFSDDAMARKIEPNASLPSQRFETLRLLSEAGIRAGVAVAPIIPGLNDGQIAQILERARAAGAREAFTQHVRLAGHTLPVFQERLKSAFPDRAAKVWSAIAQTRGAKLNESEFHARMRGLGPRWAAIEDLFDMQCRRLGFNQERTGSRHRKTFCRPAKQSWLFGEDPPP